MRLQLIVFSTYFIFIAKTIESATIQRNDLRIIGGVEVVPHSLPYQAGLVINYQEFCGAVLISAKYLLTAAHCVYKSYHIEVILGAHKITGKEITQKRFYNPSKIIHEHFTGNSFYNDIALLKLPKYVQLTESILPITKLADKNCGNFRGSTGILSGWGSNSDRSSSLESRLQKVNLDVMSNQKCNSSIIISTETEAVNILESQICTCGSDSLAGAVGACFGDSGGPLVVGNTLIGLVSFGYDKCEAKYPTIYTRISSFREWISKYSGV